MIAEIPTRVSGRRLKQGSWLGEAPTADAVGISTEARTPYASVDLALVSHILNAFALVTCHLEKLVDLFTNVGCADEIAYHRHRV